MRMIVTGGGTGGHLFPGIAVAEAMRERFPAGELLFVSTDRAVDNKALANRDFRKTSIRCEPLKGRSPLAALKSLGRLPVSLWQALKIVRAFKPDLVLGVGGYVTGPVVLAAKLMGVKACIHEQNSIPGMANRILGKIVDRIYISIPGSERFFPAEKVALTGNPIRAELLAFSGKKTAGQRKCLLVLGGSQGAHRVNELVVAALCGGMAGKDLRVVHQTGGQDEEWVRNAYAAAGVKATVTGFISEMGAAYAEADLVLSRAGATTLAELAVLGKPAILIPYPFAADDHQTTNARFLVEGGAAVMFQEQDLDGGKLAGQISGLLTDPLRLLTMAEKMKTHAKPAATTAIVEESLRLLRAA
ncbi:undecaprenyldiphospho-muramoylpentapeptide beta-N-acetylglucosaminyltransferase [Thiovibrio sp. JS02]